MTQHGQAYPGPEAHTVTYPSTGPANAGALFADFTPTAKLVQFKVGDDLFTGVPEIPALAMMQYAARSGNELESMDDGVSDGGIEALTDLIRLVLVPESADLLLKRMTEPESPIGLDTYSKIIPWLMEQYGMRPTEPSPESPNGSPNPDDGTNSTVVYPPQELTSSPSPLPGA